MRAAEIEPLRACVLILRIELSEDVWCPRWAPTRRLRGHDVLAVYGISMTISVNPTTLLFEDLTAEESSELFRMTEGVVMRGDVPRRENPLVQAWIDAAKFDDRQWLLTMGVVFPQRALLSLLLSLLRAGFKAEA